MLPESAFHPLDLDAALDEAFDAGDDAVVALLEPALSDPSVAEDERIEEYVDLLVEAYRNTGRERDAIEFLQRFAAAHPGLAGPLATTVAGLHADLGEHLVAVGLLTQRHAEMQALPLHERDVAFYAVAAMVAGTQIGDAKLAGSLVSDGLALALARRETSEVLLLRALFERLVPQQRGREERELARAADRFLQERREPAPGRQRQLYRMAYLPEPEYAAARARGLLDATLPPRHEDYRRETQDGLEAATARPGAQVRVTPLDVAGLLAFAEREGRNPASRRTRLAYSEALAGDDRDVAFPPERNAPCWCGSGRKYKKCCGTPGFAQVAFPDPASLVLRVELDDVEPPVWRRLAVPSNTPLDQVHKLIQSAMGWHDQHLYEFDNGEDSVVDPRSEGPGARADQERLISIVREVGDRASYIYDFGDNWAHTITLEEIREAGPENVPAVLDGTGDCPPEDCGGPPGYAHLLQVLADPTHPEHQEYLQRYGDRGVTAGGVGEPAG